MAQPYKAQVHIDSILTNISVAYMQMQSNFIASRVFPVVRVNKQSDKYFVYRKNDWFRDEAQRRPDATESAGSGYNLDTDSYNCDVWAMHKDVGDQVRANADSPLDMDRDAAAFVMQRLMLRQELQWVSDYFTTSVWATDSTPSNLWSDYSLSDPETDIETAKTTILSTTGFEPNTMVLGYQVFSALKNHPSIVDRIRYTSSENVTPQLLARMFDVENLYVARAVKATNLEGETAAYSFAHGKHAWLGYVNPTPSLLAPSAGYIFAWEGVSQGLGETIGVSSFRMDHLKATRIEGEIAFDDKVVASDLGYFFNGAVA